MRKYKTGYYKLRNPTCIQVYMLHRKNGKWFYFDVKKQKDTRQNSIGIMRNETLLYLGRKKPTNIC